MRMRGRAAAAVLGSALAALPAASPGGAATATTSCPAALVHYRPYPGTASGLTHLPWVRGTPSALGLVGLLAYWPDAWRAQKMTRATIYAGGRAPAGVPNMKILWVFLSPTAKGVRDADRIVIKGRRLDGPGTSWQQFVAISYNGQSRAPSYASTIALPSAGCWRLTLTAGPLHAAAVFRAIPRSG